MNKKDKDSEDEGSQAELLQGGGGQLNGTSKASELVPTDKQAKRKKLIKWGVIGAIILIIIILAIVLPLTLKKSDDKKGPPFGPGFNPYRGDPKSVVNTQGSLSGIIQTGLEFGDILSTEDNSRLFSTGYSASSPLGVNTQQIPKGVNNPYVKNIRFDFDMIDFKTARVIFSDNDNPSSRFNIPDSSIPKKDPNRSMRLEMLGFEFSIDPFYFSFSDVVDGSTYVTTKDMTLVMMDKFIQVDFLLPSQRIFGFGERVHKLQLDEGTWTMWATGQDQMIDDGLGRKGTYGVHPFILVQGQKKGDFFGMYFKNSNAQSPVIKYTNDGRTILSYITIGGNLEAYFLIHGSAKQIIQAYQNLIGGNINLPPFWSLGWQQASQMYTKQKDVLDMIATYKKDSIPLDTIYLDFSYLQSSSNFQVDDKAFDDLTGLAKQIHDANMKLVVVLDSAIVADVNDAFYKLGDGYKAFIKSAKYDNTDLNKNLVSYRYRTKDQKVVFIDWFNDQCLDMWNQGINLIGSKVQFDGIWLNYNEPVTSVPGEIDINPPKPPTPPEFKNERSLLQSSADYSWYFSFTQAEKSTFELPFIPQYKIQYGNFDQFTLSLNGTHQNQQTEYDLHNLYGHMQSQATFKVLSDPKSSLAGKKQFILSRSTFASSGRFVSHYLGETPRDWTFMKQSIAGIQAMNMFGIPHVGADVCGFKGSKRDDEMCARWIQLATFYPLARSYQNAMDNGVADEPQEPYQLTGKYKDWAYAAIKDRYQYLRHLYTSLNDVSNSGGSCFDPAFYYYPNDDNLFSDTSSSFMVGGALLVTPVLEGNDPKTIQAYLPQGQWVNLASPTLEVNGKNDAGSTVTLNAQISTVNVHLRPGSLIPWQDAAITKAMTTQELLSNPISLVANRDTNGHADGSLLISQGIDRYEANAYFKFSLQSKSLINLSGRNGDFKDDKMTFQDLRIVNAADLSDTNFACIQDFDFNQISLTPTFQKDKNLLLITPNQNAATPIQFSSIRYLYFGTKGKDLNLCDMTNALKYKVKGDIPPLDINNKVTFAVTPYAATLQDLAVTINMETETQINIKWTYAQKPTAYKTPFEIPNYIIGSQQTVFQKKLKDVISIQNDPFQVSVMGVNGQVFTIEGLLFDEYLNFAQTKVYSQTGDKFKGVFGLGEKASHDFFYKDGVYSLWTKDIPTPVEDGKLPGKNMYGVHPFYMFQGAGDKSWVGVFQKLASAQDWKIKNSPTDGTIELDLYSIGGTFETIVMMSSSPDLVVKQYQGIVGTPVKVPQWALGWHQCRYGYNSTQQLQDVVDNYAKNGIPLDVQWSDIDYMDSYRDFTFDKADDRYKELPQFATDLNKKNMQYIPILDAGVALRPKGNYDAYTQGKKSDIFVKIKEGEDLIANVWPKDSVFPDFFNDKTMTWWSDQLTAFSKVLPFSGLWQDMNEASDFCGGLCYQTQQVDSPVKYKLKYVPTGQDLEVQSMPLDAFHNGGILELDAHSLFGTQQVYASSQWFKAQNRRTFIIERSSFAGMGKYSSRWLGDNFSSEEYMGLSVTGVMMMSIFGIPVTGSDICGFMGDTNPELCARWHMVGAFYPFSRNHNSINTIAQEPYIELFQQPYEGSITYTDIMKRAIFARYSLIRYFYTVLMYQQDAENRMLYQPLFMEFPDDQNAYNDIQYNIMLGQALKLGVLSDKLNQNQTEFYYPEGVWCNIFEPIRDPCFTSKGEKVMKRTKAYDFYATLRMGYILPFQDAQKIKPSTTVDLQNLPVDFHILPQMKQENMLSASGSYYNDDGLVLNSKGNFNMYNIGLLGKVPLDQTNKLALTFLKQSTADNYKKDNNCYAVNQNDYLGDIYFYNAASNGYNFPCKVTAKVGDLETMLDLGTAQYDEDSDRLILVPLNKEKLCMTAVNTIYIQKA